jgi:ubiquinone/menaquinone biosynthesis C-methylase UbiE
MGAIGGIIYSPFSSKEKVEKYQQIIRDEEWKWLCKEIPADSTFLDVGCGAGYAMQRAAEDLNCSCTGVDPEPGAHGVGRYLKDMVSDEKIQQGFAESIPFDDKKFDVVFSSHVLEHVNDEQKSLQEMKRVLKDDGVLIIGMPTAAMSWIRLFSQIVFLTHVKVYEFVRGLFSGKAIMFFKRIFVIISHSYPREKANSIFYDLSHYRVKNWKKIVSGEFEIEKTLEPCLYPYPDYFQWFKIHYSKWGSSSVFFVCRKKK